MPATWKIIRPVNLAIIVATFVLIRLFLFDALEDKFGLELALSYTDYTILLFSCITIAAAGYIINDIIDVPADTINKPEKVLIGKAISKSYAWKWYFFLNVFGLGLGMYSAYAAGNINLVSIHVLSIVLLYLYAVQFKRIVVLANIIVAFIIGLSVVTPAVFEPSLYNLNRQGDWYAANFAWICIGALAVFSFNLNLLREIVKDVEDMEGDAVQDVSSIARKWGVEVAKGASAAIVVFVIGLLVYAIATLIGHPDMNVNMLVIYIILIALFSLLIGVMIYKAKSKKDFSRVSNAIKIVMVMGSLSLIVLFFNYFTT